MWKEESSGGEQGVIAVTACMKSDWISLFHTSLPCALPPLRSLLLTSPTLLGNMNIFSEPFSPCTVTITTREWSLFWYHTPHQCTVCVPYLTTGHCFFVFSHFVLISLESSAPLDRSLFFCVEIVWEATGNVMLPGKFCHEKAPTGRCNMVKISFSESIVFHSTPIRQWSPTNKDS